MSSVSAMGVALRCIGSGPVEVMTRYQDFNTPQIRTPQGPMMEVPAQALVAFTAQDFRELSAVDERTKTDVWEFVVAGPSGNYDQFMYFSGADLFSVRVQRRIG